MQTRYEIATLIGYSSWADYNAADKMIMNGKNIAKFIQDLDETMRPVAQREFAMLLAEKQKTDPGAADILGYDFFRISELVRRSKYDFDSQSWDPSVETWDVIENGKAIGRIYLDMHPRPGKYSHDQTAPVLDGIRGRQLPEAILVCNFPEPTATDPGFRQELNVPACDRNVLGLDLDRFALANPEDAAQPSAGAPARPPVGHVPEAAE